MEEKIIKVKKGGKRLDVYLREELSVSRALIQEWIKTGRVEIAGKKVSPHYRVKEGETIKISLPPPSPPLEVEYIPIRIIYQDSCLAVIDKPAGLIVHPAGRRRKGTLVNALLHYFPDTLSRIGGETRRGLVHRLDKGTSGVMVIARDDKTHTFLSQQFKDREIKKVYLALVWGRVELEEGRIEAPVGRDIKFRKKMSIFSPSGKNALTFYKVKERFSDTTLLEIFPKTGRTHQIRVHLSSIRHPIVGDELYGGKRFASTSLELWKKKISRPLLHAYSLSFRHPYTEELLTFSSPLPEDFARILSYLRHQP